VIPIRRQKSILHQTVKSPDFTRRFAERFLFFGRQLCYLKRKNIQAISDFPKPVNDLLTILRRLGGNTGASDGGTQKRLLSPVRFREALFQMCHLPVVQVHPNNMISFSHTLFSFL
jgi:hypothetical protein